MFEEFDTHLYTSEGAKIKIIGVGGGGNNAVNKMLEDNIQGIDFIIANTDNQVLKDSKVKTKLLLGRQSTKGLGAGALPEIGQRAAEESVDEIKAIVKETDLIFIAAGMGGGTGTGAAPVIARIAKESGALVVGIVTTPFGFEGPRRSKNSLNGLNELSKVVDSIIVISNDRLLSELGEIPLTDSFKYSDAILKQAVRTISDLIQDHSLINLDFADVKTIIKDQGPALIGVGRASGDTAAVEAAINAINSPILESSIEGAKAAIISVAGSSQSLTISKAQEAVNTIKESASPDVDIMFGVTINEELGNEIVVSVIATGLQNTKDTINLKKASLENLATEETDIKRYKEIGTTKEFKQKDFSSKKQVETEDDDIFGGFSILDDEEEQTADSILGRE